MKKFVAGMSKDTGRVDQPENTYRDALNINLNYVKGAIVNEEGTTATGNNPMRIIGNIPLIKDQVLLLGLLPGTDGLYTESAIVLLEATKGISQLLYIDPEMNFIRSSPITGEFKVDAKGDVIVYFTDNYYLESLIPSTAYVTEIAPEFNPPRAFNVTRQKQFIDKGGATNRLYTDESNFNFRKLNLFPEVGRHSIIQRADVTSGGELKTGAYQLALCYSDENFLETDYFTVCNPVYIYPQQESALPADSHIGSTPGTRTAKAVRFLVRTFPSTNYRFLQPTIIRIIDGSKTAVKLERIPIPQDANTTLSINYSGLEDVSAVAIADILVDNVRYETAKSISQLDGRLYLSNLRSQQDIGYQRFALEINAKPVTLAYEEFDVRVFDVNSLNTGYAYMLQAFGKTIGQAYREQETSIQISTSGNKQFADILYENKVRANYFEALREFAEYSSDQFAGGLGTYNEDVNLNGMVSRGYKNTYFSHMLKNYRRGEVYAYYISFIRKDGSETFAYHIPGRESICYDTANFRPNREHGSSSTAVPDTTCCEDHIIGNASGNHTRALNTFGVYPEELSQTYGAGTRIYQITDTTAGPGPEFEGNTTKMGFWENQNEYYPNTFDFRGASVNSSGGTVPGSRDLRGEKVKHHKFPSNANATFAFTPFKGNPNDETEEGINNYLYTGPRGHQKLIEDNITSFTESDNAKFENAYRDRILQSKEKIRLMGVAFDNIRIPKPILSQVRGYKIYYAKRNPQDRLIAGQSLAVPGQPRYASVPTQSRLLGKKGPYKKAFYLYGGLTHTDANSMLVSNVNKHAIDSLSSETEGERGRYVGNPVFTFHDFDMLRKRPQLDNLTHAVCQYGVVFRAFQGGPGLSAKVATPGELFSAGYDVPLGKDANTRFTNFNSLDWVHPDLGNNQNFNADGELFEITDQFIDLAEDVANPYGYAADPDDKPNARKRGRQARKDAKSASDSITAEDISVQELSIGAWKGQVNIASSYMSPGEAMSFTGVIKGGAFFRNYPGGYDDPYDNGLTFNTLTDRYWHANKTYTKHNNFWNFAISASSKKYIQGLKNTAVDEAAAFSGASILYNRGGETALAIGLLTGLPHLRGLRPGRGNFTADVDAAIENGASENLLKWGDDNKWCFPDAAKFPTTRIPRYVYNKLAVDSGNDSIALNYPDLTEGVVERYRGLRFSLEGNNPFDGHPMAWLVNLQSIKTDVFQPFDKQELVWTGLYQELESVNLETGVVTDLDSVDQANPDTKNYYTGAVSPLVFGGDTYISKYSFRTTSQSYGHIYFRGATNLGDPGSAHTIVDGTDNTNNKNNWYLGRGTKDRFQGDIPIKQSTKEPLTEWGLTNDMSVWIGSDRVSNSSNKLESIESEAERSAAVNSVLNNPDNFVQGSLDPVATLFSFHCESDSNLGLRHNIDPEKGVDVKMFDVNTAREVLFDTPMNDHTAQDNLLYNDDYSALNTTRVARPYPKRRPGDEAIYNYTTRIIRSKPSGLFIGDKYREFLANDFKDIPKDRGDIWNLFSQNGLLYIHTERTLFRTQGKEELQINAATAFVGSGNILAQEPAELSDTDLGYGGTTSVLGGVSTPYGRFWVSRRDRKVYKFAGQAIEELTSGMETWLRDNIPFQIEQFGIDVDSLDDGGYVYPVDATTGASAFGFTTGYDPKYKRVLITKKERIPTARFIAQFNSGTIRLFDVNGLQKFQRSGAGGGFEDVSLSDPDFYYEGGWTISYYPELQIWGSRHSYEPTMYISTQSDLCSVSGFNLWRHDNQQEPGKFYGTTYNSEFEFIDNSAAGVSKVFTTISYWADIVKKDDTHVTEYEKRTYPGFDSFYVYNSTQISSIKTNINYLNNARLVDKFWYLNSFRDLSKSELLDNDYINTGTTNVIGGQTTSITAPLESEPMFTSEGVVNPDYIDSGKQWYNRKKMVDHYMGVRLINDNSSTNLVYLYAAGTKFRQSLR